MGVLWLCSQQPGLFNNHQQSTFNRWQKLLNNGPDLGFLLGVNHTMDKNEEHDANTEADLHASETSGEK